MVSKKDFVRIALELRYMKPPAYWVEYAYWARLVRHLAVTFYYMNPKFDDAKFLEACGLNEVKDEQ